MSLQLYNTLTRKKAPLVARRGNAISLYVCGVTVWDSSHIGHARAAIVFDLLARYLRHQQFAVTYARNYTDVDDKIINRANQEGVSWKTIAEKYIAEYAADLARLGNITPDIEPKASDHIPQMITAIEQLIARDMAYAVHGDVYFAVRKFPGYGKLSGKKIEELEVGARVEANEAKRDPLDFALWKAAKPGEPAWSSPWGEGRPGWHIECSVMSAQHLGLPVDIHGGGRDLIFPHHENEIAQAEGLGVPEFACCWMHNGSLTINDEKMSKSLGNYLKISDALEKYDVETLRYFLLASHYRSPLDFTEQAITDSERALSRVYEMSARLTPVPTTCVPEPVAPEGNAFDVAREAMHAVKQFPLLMRDALDDDLNTPKLFAAVFDVVRVLNRYLDSPGAQWEPARLWIAAQWDEHRTALKQITGIFGSPPAAYIARMAARATQAGGIDAAAVDKLLDERNLARKNRDFKRADEIRDQLAAMNIVIKDRPDGTTGWKVER